MPISDHYAGGATERLAVRIVTVDVVNGRIEAVGKDASVIQVGVSAALPATFVWPTEGEYWIITRVNGVWNLDAKISHPDDIHVTNLAPGDALIQSDTIWTASGAKLVRSDQLEVDENRISVLEDIDADNRINTLEDINADSRLDTLEKFPVVKTIGPIAGDGGVFADGTGHFRTLPGLVLSRTTGPVSERARIESSVRVDGMVAAWNNVYTGTHVAPAPTSRLLTDAVAGTGPTTGDNLLDVKYVHSAGPVVAVLKGVDTMILAPNTTYGFWILGGGSGASGSSLWTSVVENIMICTFWPEPAP